MLPERQENAKYGVKIYANSTELRATFVAKLDAKAAVTHWKWIVETMGRMF